jgi:hypothetical protein
MEARPQHPLDRRLCGPQSQSYCYWMLYHTVHKYKLLLEWVYLYYIDVMYTLARISNIRTTIGLVMPFYCITADWELQWNHLQIPWNQVPSYFTTDCQLVCFVVKPLLWPHDHILSLKSACYSHSRFGASSVRRGQLYPLSDALVLVTHMIYIFLDSVVQLHKALRFSFNTYTIYKASYQSRLCTAHYALSYLAHDRTVT